MNQKVKWLWSKIGFLSFKTEGANLQISVNFPFVSGLLIGATIGMVIW